MLACIDDPKLALPSILLPPFTACLAVSSVISGTLRRRLWVVWLYSFSALHMSLSVGRQSVSVSATVTAVSFLSHQFRLWFRLQPQLDFSYGVTFGYSRNQKNWFRSVSSLQYIIKPLVKTVRQTDGHLCSGYTSACLACYATELVKIVKIG